jgi:competence protein ComEA
MTRKALLLNGAAILAALVIGYSALRLSQADSAPNIVISDDVLAQKIAVEVIGAVATPGVYWLEGDARVQTALDAAGGARPDADLTGLNLARRLADEEQLVVPFASQASAPPQASPAGGTAASTSPPNAKVNINTATAEQLDSLPGIGPALAGRIVAYREQHGAFSGLEELSNVSGISPKMVEELRDKITVGP